VKTFTAAELVAYGSRQIVSRNLIYVVPKDRSTGVAQEFGFWDGIDDVTIDVRDGLTASVVPRNFSSKGAVLTIGDISLSDTLNVSSLQVSLSNLNANVESAIRTYDMRNAPIQIYRALFNTDSPSTLVDYPRCRFVGYVDTLSINQPAVGGEASAVLNCVSCTRELTRKNAELRSDESQQRRHSGDRFFQYTGATGQVQVFWGQSQGTAAP
jgi:hypothetical protein